MASWYSKLLTTTTSQISNLQSKLLQSENDGDTEDDTHVCRVLRAYYTEQGKPFPGWLPPDPKAPPPVAPTYAQPQVGSKYGRMSPQQSAGPTNAGPAPTGLSSLWGDSRGRGGAGPGQQQQAGQTQSLRGGGNNNWASSNAQSRLPSQRGGGGYQQNSPFSRDPSNSTPPASSGSGGASAQDKLKQRLWGGGARTTSPSSGTGGPFQPPGRGGGGGGYSSSNRGGDSGDYESRFAPGGMYDTSSGRSGSDKPFMAANSPWASNEDEFSGGGRSNRAGGLPSGPRRGVGGLPTGPRMR
ncbi:hypothetical protein jhhlp_002424 [Lomentospora prolificans]|uniref:Mso1 N-terminal domain-containing protein n=1 Tax=Lomentospora prolificans TaxID=41688 RepID=A0A2N3NE10_9PEZI|nr:hypothetical protein jhhlp_002424 [Lomentospora prolificans]